MLTGYFTYIRIFRYIRHQVPTAGFPDWVYLPGV